ncbi:MAG: bifunctional riboflavin kinase/FAD synthetase [Deltaproteobacteria bacterium]|nr:bifunctional riboflavin kinase/FAD synthetase [Deltaproteobacteria bacterium]
MMRVFHDWAEICGKVEASAVAIGNFDGVHLGHQLLINQAITHARQSGHRACVLTFYPHPVEVLNPTKPLQRLTTASEKLGLFEALGVDDVLVVKFDEKLANLSPAEFFDQFLVKGLRAKSIHVGFNFTFGRKREGTPAVLKSLCDANQMAVHIMQTFKIEGSQVSSTLIRTWLREGDVLSASKFLGRAYSIAGQVVRGEGRGKTLGFPTANLRFPFDKLVPKPGVYSTRTLWQKQNFQSVTNVGFRPTFQSEKQTLHIETYLIDLDEPLYDELLEIQFIARIRDEKKFDSVDELKAQIALDIKTAKSPDSTHPPVQKTQVSKDSEQARGVLK